LPKKLLDLCCGLGGWSQGFQAEGWQCTGVDVSDFARHYPGTFIQADILRWSGWMSLRPDLVVASPPCDEFSRFSMPWTRAANPPNPDLRLVCRCVEIAHDLDAPMILENVRGAQDWLGRSKMNCGPFHLWGDVPPVIPGFQGRKKESFGGSQKEERAIVPEPLARHLARCFLV